MKNIGFMAHVDAGKTTLTEQFLFHTGAIRSLGSVDNGTARTDYMEFERRRGISVRSAVTRVEIGGDEVNIIDTPGHIDFSAEVERARGVLDGVILVISAVEGVQAHTEIIWRALKKRKMPTVIFVNKIDRVGADFNGTCEQIRKRLTGDIAVINEPVNEGENSAGVQDCDYIESVAEYDEALLEKYVSGDVNAEQTKTALVKLSAAAEMCCVLCGSAMQSVGIDELIYAVDTFLPDAPCNTDGDMSGLIFKIEHDKVMGRIAYVRMFSGFVHNRDTVNIAGKEMPCKVSQIRRFYGEKHEDIGEVGAGDIAALCGLGNAEVGDIIGNSESVPQIVKWVTPLLRVAVAPFDKSQMAALGEALTMLTAEEPLLNYIAPQNGEDMVLNITGSIQTEVIGETLSERFGIQAIFGEPRIIYKETPIGEGIGIDRYTMPKPCWAVLHFKVEPLPRGSGIQYECTVPPKKIPYRYQNHVRLAVPRALKQGLSGFEVTDIKVTLFDGGYHEEHTHPLDFFVATPMALAKALEDAGMRLLEPVLKFEISADEQYSGKIISEMVNIGAIFETDSAESGRINIMGKYTLSKGMDFPVRLASATSGKAVLSTAFDGYTLCDESVSATTPRHGVNPLDRSKFILWARNALGDFGDV